MALSQLALLDVLGLKADMAAGHSFGEIMALHRAGVMDIDTALTVSAERGAHMAEAASASEGAMLAVQTDAETIAGLIKKAGLSAVLANDNAPDQIVLSGTVEAIEAAQKACEATGFKARRLPVATAFHSEIVEAAVTPFAKVLAKQKLRSPKLDVYANTTASKYACKVAELPDFISGQLVQPVRFREQVEAMHRAGARIFVEIGPGSVVSGLVGNILQDKEHLTVSLDHKRRNGVNQFLAAAATLAVSGISLDFGKLFEALPPQPEKPAPSKHAVMISGANYKKPYPPETGAAGKAAPNPRNLARETAPAPRPALPEQTGSSPMTKATPPAHSNSAPGEPATSTVPATVSDRIISEMSVRHSEYMSAMTSAHTAFLSVAGQIAGVAGHQPSAPPPPPAALPAPVSAPAPAPTPSGRPNGSYMAEQPSMPVPASLPAQPAAQTTPSAPPAAPTPQPAAAQMPAPAMNGDSLGLVRSIIAEKTGYPEDMLEADMDLEGELGVDSIKQVEILSTIRERIPALPEIDPEQLVELRTIAAIADMIDGADIGATPRPNGAGDPSVAMPAAESSPAPAGGVSADIVRALIAEKTGYPEDMLEDDMDLEGELGVDSIKQVEILSSLRDQYPDLPEVDPEELTELRTIRAIADFFR